LIVLLLPFGFVFTGTLQLHELQLLAIGLLGAAGWIRVVWRPSDLPWSVVVAPLPLFVVAAITALTSPYPSLSWTAAWQTAAYIGIFWLLAVQASRPAGRRDLLEVVTIVLIMAIAAYLIAVAMAWREWLAFGFPVATVPLRPLVSGGLALLPTWLADLVALLTPVVVAMLWSRGARVLAIILGAVGLGTILLTETRSVLLLILAMSAVTALLFLRARSGRGIVALVTTAAIALGIVGLIVVLGSARGLDEGRSSAYASAISRFAESPVVGSGPGTYAVKRMRDPVDTLEYLAFPDAHNVVLNTAAESGIVGLSGLFLTVALLGVAIRRSWRASADGRLIIAGALFGSAIFVGHSMVDVVAGVVGIVIIALAVLALAVTHEGDRASVADPLRPYLRIGLGTALLVVVLMSIPVIRTEGSIATIAAADGSSAGDPAATLTALRRVTDADRDLVPAWWAEMIAADAAGDVSGAIAAARQTTDLEGFGQEWLALATLTSRAGDQTTAREALTRATSGEAVDPLVQLNAAILLAAAGDRVGAEAAARRLLHAQPDIESVLARGPQALSEIVAGLRAGMATEALDAGDHARAFLIALSGEDRDLADALVGRVGSARLAPDPRILVDAWFGSERARVDLESAALADPSPERLLWAWRVAAHACDSAAAERWSRALEIINGSRPTMPTALGMTPAFQGRILPPRYPTFVWRLEYPLRRYVNGTWVYTLGRSSCSAAVGG